MKHSVPRKRKPKEKKKKKKKKKKEKKKKIIVNLKGYLVIVIPYVVSIELEQLFG